MQSVLLLGRQPLIGLAELQSLFGSPNVRAVGDIAAVVDVEPAQINFERLGGSIKCGQLISTLDDTGWRAIERHLITTAAKFAETLGDGKLQLGVSAYGFHELAPQLTATGLNIKKALRKAGRSVRLVPNVDAQLSSAQVYHNKLTAERGWEVIILRDGDKTIIARTTAVQDIDGYTLRDRGRPKRDARVGMLPPKLAQIIVNLAAGSTEAPSTDDETAPKVLLDPFCGTGVVLQEAQLDNFTAYGTDIDSRMIDYSQENLKWLDSKFKLRDPTSVLEQGDATNHTWQQPIDLVACETYLGRPFTTVPDGQTLSQTITECNLIIKKFLQNIHTQLQPNTRLCVAVPAWHVKPGEFKHLPLIDQLSHLGYNRVSFEHVRDADLLYYREDQIVARELLVITRN